MKNQLKTVTSERDSLRVTVEKRKDVYVENDRMVGELRAQAKKIAEMEEKMKMLEERGRREKEEKEKVVKDNDELRAKFRELLDRPKQETNMHFPFMNNRLAHKPLIYTNFSHDDTQDCYSSTDTYCLHVNIKHCDPIQISYQKPYRHSK